MLNMYMAKGMSREEYLQKQAIHNEEKLTVDTSKRLQSLETSLSLIRKEQQDQAALLSTFKSQLESSLIDFQKRLNDFQYTLRQSLNDFKDDLATKDKDIDEIYKDFNKFVDTEDLNIEKKNISNALLQTKAQYENLKAEIYGALERLRLEVLSLFKAFREEINARPSGISEVKQALSDQIQLIELNGQNSIIRSANNEKQIMLIERKIENIYQLIKRIDLQNQEQQ